jgi:hypothetical protein
MVIKPLNILYAVQVQGVIMRDKMLMTKQEVP